MSKSDFTCVAWFSDVTKALEYTVDGDFSCDIPYVGGKYNYLGCRLLNRKVHLYDAHFDKCMFDFDTVIEKVHSDTVGAGWAVWVRKPEPEWTEWKTFVVPEPWPGREYRMGINGGVEYREKKNV